MGRYTAMVSRYSKLVATLCVFSTLLVSAVPIGDADDGKSGFLPPPPGGLNENPPKYKPMSAFDYESLVRIHQFCYDPKFIAVIFSP